MIGGQPDLDITTGRVDDVDLLAVSAPVDAGRVPEPDWMIEVTRPETLVRDADDPMALVEMEALLLLGGGLSDGQIEDELTICVCAASSRAISKRYRRAMLCDVQLSERAYGPGC